MSGAPDPLLAVTKLGAGYGEMAVLHDIDISIYPHETVAIVGSNAGGKTTLLRALSRVIPCTGGIRFAGRAIRDMSPSQVFALGMVQVPEGRLLFDRMSVHDNLLMGAFHRVDRSGVKDSLARVYALFPALAQRRERPAGTLSGGEQQMCAIARALVAAPTLLMVDEMSLGLAPAIVDVLLGVLADVRKDGVAILLVEQDVNVAFEAADRAYVLETGRIVREGAVADLAHDPQVRKAYLG
ncbi:MAG: ABC transporter ATP-binding protein [Burkholderiales bacterium]|nr:ABC transporter ATP-binding protein [Burkholderiales bacterium]